MFALTGEREALWVIFYALTDEQIETYSAFRKTLRREEMEGK